MTTIDDISHASTTGVEARAPSTSDHEAIVERLEGRFPAVPSARVRMVVDEAAQRLANARITQYLPVLIERMSRDELTRQETSP